MQLNKTQLELAGYFLALIGLAMFGELPVFVVSLLLLVALMVTLWPLIHWLFNRRHRIVMQLDEGNQRFKLLQQWSQSTNYHQQYALSEHIAKQLFGLLQQQMHCNFEQLIAAIKSGKFDIAIPKEILQYLRQNPVYWQAGNAMDPLSKRKIYLPHAAITQFSHSLLDLGAEHYESRY